MRIDLYDYEDHQMCDAIIVYRKGYEKNEPEYPLPNFLLVFLFFPVLIFL